MPRRRILVVEDDAAIRQGLVDALSYAGYATVQAARGDVGLEKALRVPFDLVLLDLMLPGLDGLEVLRSLRGARPTLPVIVLTARGELGDRVRGLKDGADDYVTKPFAIGELLARVEAVLRRSPERPSDVRRAGATFISWRRGPCVPPARLLAVAPGRASTRRSCNLMRARRGRSGGSFPPAPGEAGVTGECDSRHRVPDSRAVAWGSAWTAPPRRCASSWFPPTRWP